MKEVIFLVIAFVFVITLSYFLTKKLASIGSLRMQGKNMKVLETLQLGMHQYLHLVQVGEKTFVMGVTKDRMNYFCEVDNDSLNLSCYQNPTITPPFEEYFKKIKNKINK